MAGVNKVILVGHVGKDPEVRALNSGEKVATLSLATSEKWKDKAGQPKEATEWHRIVLFNQALIDGALGYVKKGSKLYVEGQLRTRKWQGQDGKDNYTTEVVLAQYKGQLVLLDKAERAPAPDEGSYGQSPGGDLNDEIPF